MAEIASLPHITMIKEASGDLSLFTETLKLCPDKTVLSGDDPSFLQALQ